MKDSRLDVTVLKRLLEEVEQALDDGEVDRAIPLCEKVLRLDPDNIDARMYLAGIALEEGDAHRVLELAGEILKLEPGDEEALLLKAQGFLAVDDPRQAIDVCDQLLRKDPHNLEARYYYAEALLELEGGAQEAARWYESVLEEDPEHVPSMLGLGVALYECCELDEARDVLEEVLKLEADTADAHFFLGLILERRKDEVGARRAFKKAQELDPDAYPPPIKLSMEEFEKVVEEVLTGLPPRLRTYLANVPISVEELPAESDLLAAEPPLSPNIWGLFRGPSLTERIGDPLAHMPSEILLYRRNLQRGVRTRQELLEEIRTTLQHEIAHFLGLDEEQVAELGLA